MHLNNTLPAEYLHLSNIPGCRLQLVWNLWPKCSDLSFSHKISRALNNPHSKVPAGSAECCFPRLMSPALGHCPRHSDAQFFFCRRDSSEDWSLWQSSMRKIHSACHLLRHGTEAELKIGLPLSIWSVIFTRILVVENNSIVETEITQIITSLYMRFYSWICASFLR